MEKRIHILNVLVRGVLAFFALSLVVVTLLSWVPVSYTPLMLKRSLQFRSDGGCRPQREWISLEDVSADLVRAVLLCEDRSFLVHNGFDFQEIRSMWQSHKMNGSPIRGCSTITQQTAKNVFTFGTRTFTRKVIEAYWTVLMELLWSKDRILEVYLNVVEWGRGIYGAECAAQEYFGLSASSLGPEQAAAMAVCLPRPLLDVPDNLSNRGRKRCSQVINEMYSLWYY